MDSVFMECINGWTVLFVFVDFNSTLLIKLDQPYLNVLIIYITIYNYTGIVVCRWWNSNESHLSSRWCFQSNYWCFPRERQTGNSEMFVSFIEEGFVLILAHSDKQ